MNAPKTHVLRKPETIFLVFSYKSTDLKFQLLEFGRRVSKQMQDFTEITYFYNNKSTRAT